MLLKSGRISLAVHSLVEVIILFSLFYFIGTHATFIEINSLPFDGEEEVFRTEDINLYRDFLLYSGSVTFMNISFDPRFLSSYLAISHVAQVFLSLVLIVLSIATYIGLGDKLSQRDENFYLRTHSETKRRDNNKVKSGEIKTSNHCSLPKGKMAYKKDAEALIFHLNNKGKPESFVFKENEK